MAKRMTFHESYGELPSLTLTLIKRFNVSPADFDLIDHCMQQMSTADTADEWWDDVDNHIIRCSTSGMYVNLGF